MTRSIDISAISCQCGWKGEVRDCINTYEGVDDYHEPVDLCPKCSEQLRP